MNRAIGFLAVFAVSFILTSCFSITVNVYFPEKDVKSAFMSLENQLMKGDKEAPGAPEEKPAPGGVKPQSWLDFGFVQSAYAQDAGEFTEALADRLKEDPEVVRAYKEMGERLDYVNRLRAGGTVGEGNDGLLKPRGSLGKKETAALSEENANRKTIIDAMAKAIVEINGQEPTKANVSQVQGKAAEQFASVRRESAKLGWWIQKADGSWEQK